MSRWEPNARERLLRAALELFGDRGYDNVTVAEIAEHAGLTKRTFFRHFTDKREALFLGQDEFSDSFTSAIAAAPAGATPIELAAAALDGATSAFPLERRELVRQRQAVIASNTDLRERDLLKRAAILDALTEALLKRGLPEPTAHVAATLVNLALDLSYLRWVEPDCTREYRDLAREVLGELHTAIATLGE